MGMHKKRDNNLIKLTFDTGHVNYFTSENKAGEFIGKQKYNIIRALIVEPHRIDFSDRGPCYVELVDGSKIPYKLINCE